MNWGAWLQGLISALATAGLTILATMATLEKPPTGWQLFIIAGIPALVNFFAYIKQTPPPLGKALLLLALCSTLFAAGGCAGVSQEYRKNYLAFLDAEIQTVRMQEERIPDLCEVGLFDAGWMAGIGIIAPDDMSAGMVKRIARLRELCAKQPNLTAEEKGEIAALGLRLWADRALNLAGKLAPIMGMMGGIPLPF